jgi:nucleolar protein 56
MVYYFRSIVGNFDVDDTIKSISPSKQKGKTTVPKEKMTQALVLLKDPQYYDKFSQENMKLTKQGLKESVNEDQLIIQTISNITELERICNILSKRLREWYSLYLPEFSEEMQSHEKFTEMVMTQTREELMQDLSAKKTMGADLDQVHVDEIILLAKEIISLYKLREKHEAYLEKIMKKYCPNLVELAGVTVGGKLLELGKSLKRLALLPSSTIQLLGAEKALFRHLKTDSKSPKYGIIFQHPFIQKARRQDRGRMARSLADKLSLCCRLDFFKGEFKAPEYKKELEEKMQQ